MRVSGTRFRSPRPGPSRGSARTSPSTSRRRSTSRSSSSSTFTPRKPRRSCAASSGSPLFQWRKPSIYCATKAALHSFALSMRHQLATGPITVVEIVPRQHGPWHARLERLRDAAGRVCGRRDGRPRPAGPRDHVRILHEGEPGLPDGNRRPFQGRIAYALEILMWSALGAAHGPTPRPRGSHSGLFGRAPLEFVGLGTDAYRSRRTEPKLQKKNNEGTTT